MVERQGAAVAGIFGIIGLPFLGYDEKIGKYHPQTLVQYHGE
jgi:adenine phosphoribosyltransferase